MEAGPKDILITQLIIRENIMKLITLVFLILTSLSAAAADKVLYVLTNHAALGETNKRTGFFLSELTHPYYKIKDAGYEIELASPLGGPAPIDPKSLDLKDKTNQRFFKDTKLLGEIQTTKKLSEVDLSTYKAVVFAGGHGTMWDFPKSMDVKNAVKTIYEGGGVVAAVCHGPAALVDIKLSNGKYLVDGKKLAVFTDEEEKVVKLEKVVPFLLESKLLKQGGKKFSGEPWTENAVVDNRLVTGQNPQSASKLGKLVVEELKKLK